MLALPIRVRGMSTENKFFDESTQTILISQHGCMTRIKNLVELDSEVHVVSTKNDVAGTFSVVWVNTTDREGFYHLGLQLLQAEGDMWGIRFPATPSAEDESSAHAWLECTRCQRRHLASVPLSEMEFLGRGVLVARACDKCKATTPWAFAEEDQTTPATSLPEASHVAPLPPGVLLSAFEPVYETPSATSNSPERRRGPNDRGKGRAPIKLRIKIIRDIYGTAIEDVCDTINVSRNGACFLTSHNYYLGETVKAILPYEEGGVNLPVLGKVVRKDQPKGSIDHLVAVQMEQAVYLPGVEEPAAPAPVEKKRVEKRDRSRVPLKFPIKVIRQIQGKTVEDLGETINISRTGAYFQTPQSYDAGETVQVIMPYKPGDVAIPVPARVVRQDPMKGSVNHAVAIRMGETERSK
jgi:Tfp pilus assembly protein PilZ